MIRKSVDISLQLLSLVQSLRAAGFFTAVALSSPFGFEGTKRVQAAEQLIQAAQHTAHLVSVIEQACHHSLVCMTAYLFQDMESSMACNLELGWYLRDFLQRKHILEGSQEDNNLIPSIMTLKVELL